MSRPVPVVIAPEPPGWMQAAVEESGGVVTDAPSAEVVIWTSPDDVDGLRKLLEASPGVRWVQLPWAGVDPYVRSGIIAADRLWTSAKGVYSEPVAEHALALTLALTRDLVRRARDRRWSEQSGTSLAHGHIVVVGAGGIARSVARMLTSIDATVTLVNRTGAPVDAWATVPISKWGSLLPSADIVILALPLTEQTRGLVDAAELAAMPSSAILINVARGEHVVTDALVDALVDGQISGAGLDVTDPEPLPDGHPLWDLPGCLITPHMAVPASMAQPLLAGRIRDNIRRYRAGEALIGGISADLGY